MESLFFTLIVLLCIADDEAKQNPCSQENRSGCSDLIVDNARVCYKKYGKDWRAEITCNIGRLTGQNKYTCQKNAVHWTPSIESSCYTTRPKPPSTISPSSPPTTTMKLITTTTFTTKESDVTPEAKTDNAEVSKSSASATGFTESSSGAWQKTTLISTITYKNETEGNSNNTTQFTEKVPASSEDSSSVVVILAVSVVVVITLAVVIVFVVWRRRCLKQHKAIRGNSVRSISNRGYDDDHGLGRHISLLDMHPYDSIDSKYAEISQKNLNAEKTAGDVYHIIDNLPEEKTKRGGDYGHLNIQTSKYIDNSYSHIAVTKTISKVSFDANYDHTGIALNAQDLKNGEDNEITYNHIETIAMKNKQCQKRFNTSDDVEAVYNHAKAGHVAFVPNNEGDSYSHLNHTWQKPANHQTDLHFLTQDSTTQANDTGLYKNRTQKTDSDNDDGRNSTSQVSRDGYEVPNGISNIYFTLEPESKSADTNLSFQVTKDIFEELECKEGSDHQYFILEKADHNTKQQF